MKVSLLVLFGLIAFVYANRTIIKSENTFFNELTWKIGEPSNNEDVITFQIYLKQQNLDKLHEEFIKLTTPGSPEWRHWKTIEEVKAITAPPALDKFLVKRWLVSAGITEIEDFIDTYRVTATIESVSKLLETEFYEFTHISSGTIVNRQVNSYSVPSRIANKIQFITGVSEFPYATRKFSYTHSRYDPTNKVVPYVIDQLYDIPWEDKSEVTKDASVGVVEYEGDTSFSQSDLTYFQNANNLIEQEVPTSQIVGPYEPQFPDTEATLDIQYAWGVSYNTAAWYWTVEGWLLEWALEFQSATDKPSVVSMSWGWTEDRQCEITSCEDSEDYVDRVNTEFEQITMTGVTITASSGDQGAPGDGDTDCQNSKQPLSSIFPGASPYVLSIGATMLVDPGTYAEENKLHARDSQPVPPICSEYTCADTTTLEEVACSWPDALITTGGGFSDYSPRPDWQDTVVTAYLQNTPPSQLPPAVDFNAANRGFPDVSALGHNYLVRRDNSWESVDGTSCSSPVWAGLISLWNDYEAKNGRPTLGFINPLIYQAYGNSTATFNDIVNGGNKCTESQCCEFGFPTAVGWDPVTGLGSPNFSTLYDFIQGQSSSLYVEE